jgi:hypothetical protein
MASVPPEIINCRNESGLRDEPSYNTKNYAVFVDTNCIGDESFDPDYFGETQFLEDIRSALEDEP